MHVYDIILFITYTLLITYTEIRWRPPQYILDVLYCTDTPPPINLKKNLDLKTMV